MARAVTARTRATAAATGRTSGGGSAPTLRSQQLPRRPGRGEPHQQAHHPGGSGDVAADGAEGRGRRRGPRRGQGHRPHGDGQEPGPAAPGLGAEHQHQGGGAPGHQRGHEQADRLLVVPTNTRSGGVHTNSGGRPSDPSRRSNVNDQPIWGCDACEVRHSAERLLGPVASRTSTGSQATTITAAVAPNQRCSRAGDQRPARACTTRTPTVRPTTGATATAPDTWVWRRGWPRP